MVRKKETLGEFIRRERESKGFKLREMARLIKVSPTFMSKVETEDWKPGEDKLRKIAETLECDVDVLLALAGKVSSDLEDIIKENPRAQAALLRTTKGMTADEIEKIARDVQRVKQK